MTRFLLASIVLAAGTLSGCASLMSGVGGSERYGCKAPEGVACTSVSGAYANSLQPTPRPAELPPTAKPPAAPPLYGASSIIPASAGVPTPPATASIRSNARVLRLWLAPWEDSDGDLHEEATVHVMVHTGRWLIDYVRPAPRSRTDGVAPPLPTRESAAPISPGDAPVSATRLPPLPGAAFSGASDSIPAER